MTVFYKVTFSGIDTYFLYINDVKQNVSAIVTTDSFTSEVNTIFPTTVVANNYKDFILKVDTNFGFSQVKLI